MQEEVFSPNVIRTKLSSQLVKNFNINKDVYIIDIEIISI